VCIGNTYACGLPLNDLVNRTSGEKPNENHHHNVAAAPDATGRCPSELLAWLGTGWLRFEGLSALRVELMHLGVCLPWFAIQRCCLCERETDCTACRSRTTWCDRKDIAVGNTTRHENVAFRRGKVTNILTITTKISISCHTTIRSRRNGVISTPSQRPRLSTTHL
jgi:hypothetical protein